MTKKAGKPKGKSSPKDDGKGKTEQPKRGSKKYNIAAAASSQSAAAPLRPGFVRTPTGDVMMNGYGFEALLRKNERGRAEGTPYKSSIGNLHIILTQHPLWKGLWADDSFIGDITLTRPAYWPAEVQLEPSTEWTTRDYEHLAICIDQWFGIAASVRMLMGVISSIAKTRPCHAVKDYLEPLKWDGKPRIDDWLIRIAGAEDSKYVRAVSAKFLIGAVARVMDPGCKLDTMAVFEGKQGIQKSQMIERLFVAEKGWYSGTPFVMGTKDGYQTLRRKWGLEIPELSHFDRAEMNAIKAFLSTRSDNYRPSYAIKNEDFPRQSICVGTTNDSDWHKDNTGGRRFWPVYLTGINGKIDLEQLMKERDQLWAEALVRYRRGEKWWLEDKLAAAAEAVIDHRRQLDPWEERIAAALDANEAKYRTVLDDPRRIKYRYTERGLSTGEILDMFDIPLAKRTRLDEMRVGGILRALGWARREKKDGGSRYRYFPEKEVSMPPRLVQAVSTEVRVQTATNGGVGTDEKKNVHSAPTDKTVGS
jgi:predicted P-loop ATPase